MIVVILVSFQKNFCVLKEEDILKHQIDAIERVSVVLSITEVEASILLRSFHWSVGKVHDEWFADEERVRNTVGILERPVVAPSDDTELTCGICFDPYPPEKIASVSCGHPFCTTCWTGENSDHVVGVLSPHESPERELEDGEIDNLKRNEGFPYPTTPFHLHSTAGKEGRHKNDLS
ncbi:hypothetical protein DY000_02034974 [Brassica cretica]|uniref:E3 ubiquitin-protein ligase ARIH1-like UBA-like domain-containing protein n=1 Tax=Brassica cretica TaxID=69181 RepID=A0ABQ7DYC6_BRACR|nr:hypothetical protein DY000_02034974 [Brassica cretica]